MKGITFDVNYWPGLQGKQPSRIEGVHGEDFIMFTKKLLGSPDVRGIQITIEKERGEEFLL